jgi:hypothetical protein
VTVRQQPKLFALPGAAHASGARGALLVAGAVCLARHSAAGQAL